jgi:hypothetical protein
MGLYDCKHCGREFVGEEGTTYSCWHCHRELPWTAIENRLIQIALVTNLTECNSVSVWLDGEYLGRMGHRPFGECTRTLLQVAPGPHVLKVQRHGIRSPIETPFTADGDRRRFLLDGTPLGGMVIKEVYWGFR